MSQIKKRNHGIDMLRILCLFCVIVLHILGHGNALYTTVSIAGFSSVWLWEILAYPAVNCFVLISGFVGYRENKYYPKLRNIISLYITVLFYSVLFCLCFKLIYPNDISIINLIKALMPVTTKQYWFFTSYFAMFLISPMINFFVHKADSKMLIIFSITILFFSIPPTSADPFILYDGFSFAWFSLLYALGAIIKKENIANKISKTKCVLLIACSLLITWAIKVIFHFATFNILGTPVSKYENLLVSYCSPTILIVASGLLCLFAKINIHNCLIRLGSFFSPMVFSVYLIHDNLYIRNYLMSGNFSFINNYNPLLMHLMIPGFALGIFLICSFVDHLRNLFFKLLHIPLLSEKLEIIIKSILRRIISQIENVTKR